MSPIVPKVEKSYAAMTGEMALCAFDFMPASKISVSWGCSLKYVKMSLTAGLPLRTTCSSAPQLFQKTGSPTSRTYARIECGWSLRNAREIALCRYLPLRRSNTPCEASSRRTRSKASASVPTSLARYTADCGS